MPQAQQTELNAAMKAAMRAAARAALDCRLDWHEGKAEFRNALAQEAIDENKGNTNKAAMQLRITRARLAQINDKVPHEEGG